MSVDPPAITPAPPLTFNLGDPPITLRLAVVTEIPPRAVRWLLKVAEALAAATDVDRRAAMLEIADAYHRAADAGQYSPLIRESMLAAELRARRLAEHL